MAKQKKEAEIDSKPKARRILVQPEEKAKRGRWITLLLFFLTLFFGYISWQYSNNPW